jgi:hypothetical protein
MDVRVNGRRVDYKKNYCKGFTVHGSLPPSKAPGGSVVSITAHWTGTCWFIFWSYRCTATNVRNAYTVPYTGYYYP